MFERIRRTEWPLVAFTLAMQLATGCAIAATLCDISLAPAQLSRVRLLGVAVCPAAAFGMLASLLHLGRPRASWRALLNLRTSVLSREILVSLLFLLASAAYSYWWWAEWSNGRTAAGMVTSALGVVAVALSSMVYLIAGQPTWTWWVPCSFVSTAVLLGGVPASIAVAGAADITLQRTLTGVLVAASAASLFAGVEMLARQLRATSFSDARERIAGGAYLLTVFLIPAWLSMKLFSTGPGIASSPFLDLAVFAALLGGATLQRILMYRSARVPQF